MDLLNTRTNQARLRPWRAGQGAEVSGIEALFELDSGAGTALLEPAPTIVRYGAFDLERARAEVGQDGYSIVRDLIPETLIAEARAFWLETHFNRKAGLPRVTWSPHLGQENTVGYSEDKFQCMWRSCDFLWNQPLHPLTRAICVRLNGLRNLILGLDPLLGVRFSAERYGIFVTTTYYPPGAGFMDAHVDGVGGDVPLLHHIAPLTFKGIDYQEGGMQVRDRRGKTVDVDALLRPGDVVFYDGALQHGVAPIRSQPPSHTDADRAPLGRLQMFAIPTRFANIESSRSLAEEMPTGVFLRAKWRKLKNAVYLRLGRKQVIR
jgi:hypothetical protein